MKFQENCTNNRKPAKVRGWSEIGASRALSQKEIL